MPRVVAPARLGARCEKAYVRVALLLLVAGVVIVLSLLFRGSPPADIDAAAPPAARTDAALEALQQRYGHARGNDLAPIAEAAKSLVASDPEHIPARNFLALVLSESGRPDEAYAQMSESLARDDAQPGIHFGAGVLATQHDQLEAARRHYTAAVAQAPEAAVYRVHLAMVGIKQQNLVTAEQLLLQAIQVDSNLADAYFGLAELYFLQNKRQLALQQIELAIERMPVAKREKQVKFLRKKAWILRRSNRWSDALSTLKRLTTVERRQGDVLEEMAICLGQLGRANEAAQQYEAASARDPVAPDLVAGAARWRLAEGDDEKARRHLATLRTLASDPAVIAALEAKLGQ